MRVELPDGTILEDVPEGTTKEQIRAKMEAKGHKFDVAPATPAASATVKGSDYGDTGAGKVMRFLGGAKTAWDQAAAALESAVPGGRALSEKLDQPDLQQLVKQGKQYVEEAGPAATVGQIAGEVGLTAVPGGVAYKGATMLPKIRTASNLAQRIAGGTAAGLTGSAMMGGDAEDVGGAGLVGGAAEGVLPPVAKVALKGAKAVGRGIRDVTQGTEAQASRYLQGVFGDRADEVIAGLKGAQPYIPGETVTAGKAVGAQFPEMKVLQQNAENSPLGYKFLNIDDANEAARLAPLDAMRAPGQPGEWNPVTNMIAPSPAAAARKAETTPLYAAAMPQRVEMTPETMGIVHGAEARRAVSSGERAFQQEQANQMAAGKLPPMGEIPGEAGQLATRSIEELQSIRQYLDDEISNLVRTGSDNAKLRRLSQARRELTGQMEAQSPDFAKASGLYRELSAPVNQADVANVLRGKMEQGPQQFVAGMGDAARTIQKAGVPRFEDLRQVMTPEQMDTLNALRQSAQREVDYGATRVGPGMVPKAQSAAERFEAMLPPIFSQGVTTLRKALSRGGDIQDAEIRRIINEAVLDPNKMAALIAKVPASQQGAIAKMMQSPEFQAAVGPMRGAAIGYSAGQMQNQ